jgi:alpha-tubulin suppressor-like RCC1 family protein
MPTFNFKDNDGVDIGDKYVTKEYVMDAYPDLVPSVTQGNYFLGWGNSIGYPESGGLNAHKTSPTSTFNNLFSTNNILGWKDLTGFFTGAFGAVRNDGTLWTFGQRDYGAIGDGVTATGLLSVATTTAGGGTNWKQVSSGYAHMAAVKTDGTLWTWGNNNYGTLGADPASTRSSPGTTAGGGTNWKQVSCGYYMTAAVKSDGTLWTWGTGRSSAGDAYGGSLGAGTTFSRSSPGTTAGGGTNWKSVSVRIINYNSTNSYVAAIKTDGTLWTWGNNDAGTFLATGDTTRRSSPGTTAGGGTNWKDVHAGPYGGVAIKTDGTLWTWGLNQFGQLGDGTTSNRNSPVTVAGGGTDWKQAVRGVFSCSAIKTDGSLWTWGRNYVGEQATGTSDSSRSSPGTTIGGTGWKKIYNTSFIFQSNYEQYYGIKDTDF